MNIIPAVLGVIALISLIVLVVSDLNNVKGEENSPKKRLSKTIRGFIMIICLVIIFGTLMFYWG